MKMRAKYKQARKNMEEVKLDYYICGDRSYFPDDIKLRCSKCKKIVYARPYYPRNSKIICIECMGKLK